MSFGESHYKAKLSTADVDLIRGAADERSRLIAQARKLSNANLAAKFDVSASCIERVVGFQTRKRG